MYLLNLIVPEQVVFASAHEPVVQCCIGNKQHWLKQKSMWATLVAVAVASAVMGSAITFFADAQAAKRHTALLANMELYQALGASDQVITQRIASSIIACLGFPVQRADASLSMQAVSCCDAD